MSTTVFQPVTLQSKAFEFLQMTDQGVVKVAAIADPSLHCERFNVVDASNGLVALYNAHARRFLRLLGDVTVDGVAGHGDELPPDAAFERFQVVDAGAGKVALYSPAARRLLRLPLMIRIPRATDVGAGEGEDAGAEGVPLQPNANVIGPAERFTVFLAKAAADPTLEAALAQAAQEKDAALEAVRTQAMQDKDAAIEAARNQAMKSTETRAMKVNIVAVET